MSEVTALIADVEAAREALLADVHALTEAQATFKPAADQWSVVEVIEHLFLAEFSGVSKIWAALEAYHGGQAWVGESPNAGASIEAIVARTWKPREAAPPIATPHIGGPLAYWVACTRTLTAILADLGARLDGVPLDAIVFPHFLSGPLDARQRLEFLRFHIERHRAQIAAIRAAAGFPA